MTPDWATLAEQSFVVACALSKLEQAKARKVNRQRGAYRRPALAGTVASVDKTLRTLLDDTEHQLALILAKDTDGVQAASSSTTDDGLQRAALDHHGLDGVDSKGTLGKVDLAALLLTLGLLRKQQLSLTSQTVEEVFNATRTQLLKRLKQAGAPAQTTTSLLPNQVISVFEGFAQSFYSSLHDGTPRSDGVITILSKSKTIGEAILGLRMLFGGESYRVSMFAESLVWASYIAGFRAAAVDATAFAKSKGETLPQFQWMGPADKKACAPCLEMFSSPIVANSLADIPNPWDICSFRFGCRHWWAVLD